MPVSCYAVLDLSSSRSQKLRTKTKKKSKPQKMDQARPPNPASICEFQVTIRVEVQAADIEEYVGHLLSKMKPEEAVEGASPDIQEVSSWILQLQRILQQLRTPVPSAAVDTVAGAFWLCLELADSALLEVSDCQWLSMAVNGFLVWALK